MSSARRSSGKSGRLHHRQRLHDTRDFQRVYAAQAKVAAPNVLVCYAGNGLTFSRLGVSVGSKHGNAVVRNRIKRVLRAAFRASQEHLPTGYDYVLIPRRNIEIFSKTHATTAVSQELKDAARRLTKLKD